MLVFKLFKKEYYVLYYFILYKEKKGYRYYGNWF